MPNDTVQTFEDLLAKGIDKAADKATDLASSAAEAVADPATGITRARSKIRALLPKLTVAALAAVVAVLAYRAWVRK